MRLILILLTLLSLAACAGNAELQHSGNPCALIPLAQIPVETRANLLFVQGKINDQPITMLLDTGAERTLLTEATVERLHLPRDAHHVTRTLGIGSATASWDAKLPNGITLGTTRFPVDTVTVGKFGINEIAGGSTDGLLGADILLAFDVDLDLPAHLLTLYRDRRECADPAPPWKEPYVDIADVSTRRDRLMVPFALDGVAGVAVLDTGAQVSSISRSMAERLGLAPDTMATDRTVIAHGASPDEVTVPIHRFRELIVGPAVVHAPLMPVVPIMGGMGDGLIGADFLRNRRVWLSLSSHHVFVTSEQNAPQIANLEARAASQARY